LGYEDAAVKPLLANLSDPSAHRARGAKRRSLSLTAMGQTQGTAVKAIIHNLSETGLLLQTEAALKQDEIFQVGLSDEKLTEARVVWNDGELFGCEFLEPVSQATISAAILRAVPDDSIPAKQLVEEIPVSINPSVEEVAAWKSNFEKTKGTFGYRLAGFRQEPNGLVVAIVAKGD